MIKHKHAMVGLGLMLALSACNNQPAPTAQSATSQPFIAASAGNVEQGQKVFARVGGCVKCHYTDSDTKLTGPSLRGIAKAPNAEGFLRVSILKPNEQITEGYTAGVMPDDIGTKLTAQQLADLLAYLLTLT